jgi:carboxypeptidase Q
MMDNKKDFRIIIVFLISLTSLLSAAERNKTGPSEALQPSYELPQPAKENIDYTMYQRIRDEGLSNSHVMEYASALVDGIGPRLTGSPNLKRANEWTLDQLTAMGCTNSHLEDWGEFGMGWQQLNTWVRMTSPDTAVFIAQAVPWSPSSPGPVSGQAVWVQVKNDEDLERYKGTLAGKIVLFGDMREVSPVDKPLFQRKSENDLAKEKEYPLTSQDEVNDVQAFKRSQERRNATMRFFASEKVLAVIFPSRDGEDSGGSGGTIFVDHRNLPWWSYQRDDALPVPVVVVAIENYGRVFRLLKSNVPVSIEMNVDTKFTGDHEHGFNVIAEIPGTDPELKEEVVMLGAHLDSWASATGATDNGAGTVVAMEVMRIFNTLHISPRRTIRLALWGGEEEGYGSREYVRQHFGSAPLSPAPDQVDLPESMRKVVGPIVLKPEQQKISGYFNLDNGTGKILGVYLQENAAVAPIFSQWIEPLKDIGVTTLTMRDTEDTDHVSFDSVGIPGFQFIQDTMDYMSRSHHSNMDTYERLQGPDLAQAATVEAIFVYNTAMRNQMLPRKPLPHPELEEQRKGALRNLMPLARNPVKDAK